MSQPLILVSNDDGVHSEGIHALARGLKKLGRVVIVAPDREQSTTSHSITLHRPLRVKRVAEDLYAVDGTPADCVLLAFHEILKKRPALVVSGINRGPNLGNDVHYSGTVSAAVEGALMGVPALAVSLVVWSDEEPVWSGAAVYARRIARRILREGMARGSVLNVNVPNLAASRLRGSVMTRLGKRDYGQVIFKKNDPRGRLYYWIGGDERVFAKIPGSDCEAVLQKKVSITPLKTDLTDESMLEK